jgi:hypothetical protein
MYPGQAATKFGSRSYQTLTSKDGTHRIATFPTDEQGAAAQFWLLSQPKNYVNGKRTVEEIITTWCGNFYVSTYLKVLEKQAGITSKSVLTQKMLRDPKIAIPLARAMALQEAGRDYPLDANGWKRAHEMAFDGSPAPVEAPSVPAPSSNMPSSRKDKVSKTGEGFLGTLLAIVLAIKAWLEGLISDPLGAFAQIHSFVSEYGWETAAVLALVSFLGFRLVRFLQRQDFNEGRYKPSGAAE